MRARASVVVIGAGRAGLGLARALKDAGWNLPAIVARRPAQAAAASRLLGRSTGTTSLRDAVARPGVLLVCVPDREIAGLVRQLAALPSRYLKGRVILHTSGVSTDAPIRPLRNHGASTGTLHPLVSFPPPGGRPCQLGGAAFALDGEPRALRAGRSMVKALGGIPIRVAPEDRAAYHQIGRAHV